MSGPDKLYRPADPNLVEQARRQPAVMTYGRLTQRHPEYDADRMQELHDLHAGGYVAQQAAKQYIVKLSNESGDRYNERCRVTAYLGYFGQIIEQFSSDLFAQPLSITPAADADNPKTPGDLPDEEFYKDFEANTDLQGTIFDDLMKSAITTAMVQRDAFVCIDAPEPGTRVPVNRADEAKSGQSRVYAYERSPRQVIDWKEDDRRDTGDAAKYPGFVWLIVQERTQDRASPTDVRDRVTDTFTVWTMEGERAVWDRYAVTYDAKEPPKDEDTVPVVGSGSTEFTRIPVIRMRLPKGLWVGNKVGPPQKEHWNKRSALNGAEAHSLCAIPYVKRGPEIGAAGAAQPSETAENPHRGRDPVGTFNSDGFVALGHQDELGYASPDPGAYALVHKDIDELKDEIFRITHQMAASVRPSAGSLGRSAASKQQDGKATSLVLRALGHEVRQFALALWNTISSARKEDVIWTANGLDNYETIDRESILEEAVSANDVCDAIPSETFKVTYKTQIGEKLLTGMDPRTLDQMRKEIKQGVKDEHAISELLRDNEKEVAADPPPTPGDAAEDQKKQQQQSMLAPKVPQVKKPLVPGQKPS